MFNQNNVKRHISIAIMSLSILSVTTSQVLAEEYESVTFTLENGTELPMTEFYAAPPHTTSWEEDILGLDVLLPGQSTSIIVDDGRPDCEYEFRAVFEDGSEVISTETVCNGDTYVY